MDEGQGLGDLMMQMFAPPPFYAPYPQSPNMDDRRAQSPLLPPSAQNVQQPMQFQPGWMQGMDDMVDGRLVHPGPTQERADRIPTPLGVEAGLNNIRRPPEQLALRDYFRQPGGLSPEDQLRSSLNVGRWEDPELVHQMYRKHAPRVPQRYE
jgi:hypothetical protein